MAVARQLEGDRTFLRVAAKQTVGLEQLERSRSGRGGYVWPFFEKAVPAALARKLGSTILTETMDRHPEAGLDSYDRLFPNQDTLPRGGFGNLIALPLQKQPREHGNSVFLDVQLAPYSDHLRWGRPGNPHGHFAYRFAKNPPSHATYKDPLSNEMTIELRGLR